MRLVPSSHELGWTPYGYLVYLAIFLIQPVFYPRIPWEREATALAVALFLVLYFRSYWTEGWRVMVPVVGMVLLGTLFAPINWGANCFFIYAAAAFAQAGPRRHAWTIIAAIGAVPIFLALTLVPSPFFWAPALVFVPLIGGLCVHQREMRHKNALIRQSRQETARLAQIAERERIARDLHDLLGHTLSLITLKAELAARLVERDPERAQTEMREVERVSRQATKEVRAAVTGYRHRSFSEELAAAQETLRAAGVDLDADLDTNLDAADGSAVELEPLAEGVLSLALREAVTNVVRHARARSCRVRLSGSAQTVELEITDDGRGANAPEGHGLQGMRERVAALGGDLERIVEEGTRLRIRLPRHAVEATS